MGFLDKAKQMAEQAQSKLDEVQKQFNEGQSGSRASEGPPVDYDHHGRPVPSESPAEPVGPPPATATPPHGDPLGEQAEAPPSDHEDPYAPPKLTGGDPLAG